MYIQFRMVSGEVTSSLRLVTIKKGKKEREIPFSYIEKKRNEKDYQI
jgi:hypothetical protein